jgi:hypothetical protein
MEPSLPWVYWWPERIKAYNTSVAASNEPAEDLEAIYLQLLGDQAWDDHSPEVRAERRAEGAAFQVDMASEIEAPFDSLDVHVPALLGTERRRPPSTSRAPAGWPNSSRPLESTSFREPATSPLAPILGSSQAPRTVSPT